MKKLYINQNWTFEEVVNNLKTLKIEYEGILASFSYFQLHDKVEFLRKTKKAFYSLKLKEWEINKLWEYMNGYEFLYVLKQMVIERKRRMKLD